MTGEGCSGGRATTENREISRQGAKTLSDRPKACHPERIRGIWERFLSSFEMTMLFLCDFASLRETNPSLVAA